MGFEVPEPRPRRGRWKWLAWVLSLNLFLVGAVALFAFGPLLALWIAAEVSGVESMQWRNMGRILGELGDGELGDGELGDGELGDGGPGGGVRPEHASGPEHASVAGESLNLLDPLLEAEVEIETRAGYVLRGGRLISIDWIETEIDGVELRTPWVLHFDTVHALRWDAVRRITLVRKPKLGLD
jgi:hypothetical protein